MATLASGSGKAGIRRAKNSAMAAHMKKMKITRTTCLCVMCHKPTAIGRVGDHIRTCGGRR